MNGTLDRSRRFSELLRDFAGGGADLMRGEAKLARMELSDVAANVARGGAQIALGGVLLVLGALSLAAGLVLLAGDQWFPKDRYWLAALVVMVITGAFAAWLAKRGLALLSPAQLAPDQTVETLKEDKEWLKRQLTSGATST